MNKNVKLILFLSFFCVIIMVLAFYAYAKKEHHINHEEAYLVTKPWRQYIEISNEYVAQLKSSQHIELRSLEKGYLQEIYVDEGQFVKKDQKMFQIMPTILQAEWEKVKAEYEIRKIEYNNTKNLQEKNVVSENELALAKAKLSKAEAVKKLAKSRLDFTTVRAPFDGIMDRFRVRLGSLIEEGQLLTTISDNRKVWVYFNVSEVDYLEFMSQKNANKNLPIKLKLANGVLFDQQGTLDTIEADFNNETGNIAFRASFENPQGILRHGQTGSVILTEDIEKSLVIPQKATFEILDKQFVYVINKDHKVESRRISISHELPHLYVIKAGLTEEDTILLEGLGKVHVGQRIKTHYQKTEDVKNSLNLSVE